MSDPRIAGADYLIEVARERLLESMSAPSRRLYAMGLLFTAEELSALDAEPHGFGAFAARGLALRVIARLHLQMIDETI